MYLFISNMPLFQLITSADDGPSTLDFAHMQNELLRRSLSPLAIQYAGGNADADACSWKAIQCTDGDVTTLCLNGRHESPPAILLEWLPPTMRFIHLCNAQTPGKWQHMCLPRDLKYLFLKNCRIALDGGQSRDINFARLPPTTEELILIYATCGRVICLDGLPRTMRYVYIQQNERRMHSVVVNYDGLPESLQWLRVTCLRHHGRLNRKVVAIGKPKGVKLSTKFRQKYYLSESKYARDMSA